VPLGGREWSSSLKSEAPLQSLSSLRAILLAISNDDVIPADQPAGQRLAPCFHFFRAEQSHPLAERSPLPCFSVEIASAAVPPDYFPNEKRVL
jgi:hypothetical protein